MRETDGRLQVVIGAGAPGESQRAARIGEDHHRKTLGGIEDDPLVSAQHRQRRGNGLLEALLELRLLRHSVLCEVRDSQEGDARVRRC